MAYESGICTVNAVYTGTDFVKADNNGGFCVTVVGGGTIIGEPKPRIQKTQLATDVIAGVIQSVEEGSDDIRTPSATKAATYANRGIVKMKKDASAPTLTDIGGQVMPTTTPGAVSVSDISSPPNKGQGLVVGITGTGTDDFLLVDLDRTFYDIS